MTVRTRFAPSPTGSLHIGGVRTALFSWLYARRHGGVFVLRIEDTDRQRSTDESLATILEGMAWLGLTADEGPFYQTERNDRYRAAIDRLLADGHAYRCYCTREELEVRRAEQKKRGDKPRYDGQCRERTAPRDGVPPVVRFRNPADGEVVIDDLVQGRVVYDNAELDDLIIARSDGSPTYNLTVVVDDLEMNISHVIRGDDHLNNTPRQINIFSALGATPPRYAHVPMILGGDGRRLSKRHGAVSVLDYRDQGFLPVALLNYLVRLGWSNGDRELFSIDELIELFDIADVNKSASVFDTDKLLWVNQQHLKDAPTAELVAALTRQLATLGIAVGDEVNLDDVVGVQRGRCKTLVEMAQKSRFLFEPVDGYDAKAAKKQFRPEAAPLLHAVADGMRALGGWSKDEIGGCLNDVAERFGVKMGGVAQPVRLAVTGTPVSPSIDDTLYLLGRDKTLARIDSAAAWIEAGDG